MTSTVCQPCLTALGTEWAKGTYASVNRHTPNIWKGPVHPTNSSGPEVTEGTDPRRGDSFASPGNHECRDSQLLYYTVSSGFSLSDRISRTKHRKLEGGKTA